MPETEQEASHHRAEEIGDQTKVFDQLGSAGKSPCVRDELIHFHRVGEPTRARLAGPGLHGRGGRPGIIRRIELNGIEGACVVIEPFVRL